jgi:hypothetical protein
MPEILSDNEIAALIQEPKRLPAGFSPKPKTQRAGHLRKDFQVASTQKAGNEFVLALRQSTHNSADFSAILGYKIPGSTTVFLLRRYNGNSHVHTNSIEKTKVKGFHVHTATERYQKRGGHVEGFAEPTNRYSNLDEAVDCLVKDCGFESPKTSTQTKFEFPLDTD